ncbi:hypothetical protein SMC26_32225 [Actinomadura fulvescens]|uniref:Lipoprotein n=1 Tax=Actinomadura fulvescens TaxID=46160 RepID=A0ABP6CA03_9ACTN
MAGCDARTSPPELYAWDLEKADGAGSCGMTDDREAAFGNVGQALAGAPPGAKGRVRRVEPSYSGRVGYVDLGTVGWARQDGTGVSWIR